MVKYRNAILVDPKNHIMDMAIILALRVKGRFPSIISIDGPNILFLSNLCSSQGQLFEKLHAAMITKIVVGSPGTTVPRAPRPTQNTPRPANDHRLTSPGLQLKFSSVSDFRSVTSGRNEHVSDGLRSSADSPVGIWLESTNWLFPVPQSIFPCFSFMIPFCYEYINISRALYIVSGGRKDEIISVVREHGK